MKSTKLKRATGRPTAYTSALGRTIADQIAAGTALADICIEPGMPSRSAVYEWLSAHAEFADMYARAKEVRADVLADEIISIADDDKLSPDARRVRIDARKWAAAKLLPKRYSDRFMHVGDPEQPLVNEVREVRITFVRPDHRDDSPEESG